MKPATAYAPANIALAKYWGKRDRRLNLPTNGSLSVSLGPLGTTTTIHAAENDSITLNGRTVAENSVFARRVWTFVTRFVPDRECRIAIATVNSIPTAAGLASSASGFAALTRALDRFFGCHLNDRELSLRARQGSGSACRSLWHGFVEWPCGKAQDGSDSYAFPLAGDWPALRIAIVAVNRAEKKVSSKDGMNHTLSTSPLYPLWPRQTERDLATIREAIMAKDLPTLGKTAEANALMMHATMLAARPSLCYWQTETLAALHTVWRLREEGLAVYATMDAGPNVKLLFASADSGAIAAAFPAALQVDPFGASTPDGSGMAVDRDAVRAPRNPYHGNR